MSATVVSLMLLLEIPAAVLLLRGLGVVVGTGSHRTEPVPVE